MLMTRRAVGGGVWAIGGHGHEVFDGGPFGEHAGNHGLKWSGAEMLRLLPVWRGHRGSDGGPARVLRERGLSWHWTGHGEREVHRQRTGLGDGTGFLRGAVFLIGARQVYKSGLVCGPDAGSIRQSKRSTDTESLRLHAKQS